MVTKKLTPKARTGKKPRRRKKAPRRLRISTRTVFVLVTIILVLAIALPYLLNGSLSERGARVPEGAQRFSVDLSHFNEGIVWDSLKVVIDAKGRTCKDILRAKRIVPLSSVIIKATEGTSLVDKRFEEYWKEADGHEYQRGAYHFFRSSKDPERQAAHYIAHVNLTHRDLPPILDVETMHAGCSKDELNRKVLVWLRSVEKHYGRTPIVYTPDSYARDILSPDITGHYPLWIARYNEKQPRFPRWSMWQFTDKAVLHGVSCYVDMSVLNPDFP